MKMNKNIIFKIVADKSAVWEIKRLDKRSMLFFQK